MLNDLKNLNKKARHRDTEAYVAIFKWMQTYQKLDGKNFSIDHPVIQKSMRLLIRRNSARKVNSLVKWMCKKDAFSKSIFDFYIALLDKKERRKKRNLKNPIRKKLEKAFPNWCESRQTFAQLPTVAIDTKKMCSITDEKAQLLPSRKLTSSKQEALKAYKNFLKTEQPCTIVKRMSVLKDLHSVQQEPCALTRATSIEDLLLLMSSKNPAENTAKLDLKYPECQKIMQDIIVYCHTDLSQKLIDWAIQHESFDKSILVALIKGFQTKDKEQTLNNVAQLTQIVDLYSNHHNLSDEKDISAVLWASKKLALAQLADRSLNKKT